MIRLPLQSLTASFLLHSLCAMLAVAALHGCATDNPGAAAPGLAGSAMHADPPADQQTFATPEAAVEALRAACETNDRAALLAMMGDDHPELIDSGDEALDKTTRHLVAADMGVRTRLRPVSHDTIELVIGESRWPFPIPLVRDGDSPSAGQWRWDADAGADEILSRRIGRNELAVIEICLAYVAAQAEYSRLDRDGDQVLEYAQRLTSTPGRHDGLYWQRESDTDLPSPLSLLAALVEEIMPDREEGDPLMGYRFRILARQGANVPGGKYDYVINGNMIAGFALIAWPVSYGDSGIMTFVVNHQGRVLEKDLGEKTAALAAAMKAYNPDDSWRSAR